MEKRNKFSFPNFASSRTSQKIFPKYLMESQNVKIVKSKFESNKSNKNNIIAIYLKKNEKKETLKLT